MEKMKLENMAMAKELTEKDLTKVAGGFPHKPNLHPVQYADDSRFLNVLLRGRPDQCDRYGSWRASFNKDEINKAWESVGVTISNNRYMLNGKQISQSAAWDYAQQVVGTTLNESDWKW